MVQKRRFPLSPLTPGDKSHLSLEYMFFQVVPFFIRWILVYISCGSCNWICTVRSSFILCCSLSILLLLKRCSVPQTMCSVMLAGVRVCVYMWRDYTLTPNNRFCTNLGRSYMRWRHIKTQIYKGDASQTPRRHQAPLYQSHMCSCNWVRARHIVWMI